ncbi:MAG: hypothetical protein KAS21_02200 [Candidatus Aminicenantes bacterium]|nr:hypothetical protein [Candidatus Aminicenantes bacterium]
MIHKINLFVTKAFNVILTPFNGVNDFWPVFFLSIILSFIILYILKYISFPKKIVESKEKIKANIFAIRIYKDFWKVIVSSFFKSLFHTFRYFIFNLAPFLIIIPLLLPVFSQMEVRYGMRPFNPGESIVLKADLDKDYRKYSISLEENDFIKPKMRPVFINAWMDEEKTKPVRVANWKLEAVKEGKTELGIRINDKVFYKNLMIGKSKLPLSNRKYMNSSFDHFFYPAEELIEENDLLRVIKISYPGKLINFLGIKMHWIFWNLIIVLVVILAFRKRFGVEF